jgi:hypothetical protein
MATKGNLDPTYSSILNNTIDVINRHFKKNRFKEITFKDPISLYNNLKAFTSSKYVGYAPHHFSKVFDQDSYYWLAKNEPIAMKTTCSSKFRSEKMITLDIFELIQYQKGETSYYYSGKREKLFDVNKQTIDEVCSAITNRKYKEICFNDSCSNKDFEKVRDKLIAAFEQIYPNKSKYEV